MQIHRSTKSNYSQVQRYSRKQRQSQFQKVYIKEHVSLFGRGENIDKRLTKVSKWIDRYKVHFLSLIAVTEYLIYSSQIT